MKKGQNVIEYALILAITAIIVYLFVSQIHLGRIRNLGFFNVIKDKGATMLEIPAMKE